jgi:hypothetical protein
MKKIVIVAASLMFAGFAQAEDVMMVEVEMTPIVKEAPKGAVKTAKSDSRFDNYALENIAAGGQ